ncbi:MAG TPA: hypothetical protein VG406_21960 [Isosphaeraceae bacterium]|jgi:hypothetical protein|nr:hypothetical protein [Isosphaeraceae bacterium]
MAWLTYVGAFLWGFVLLASFAGHGELVARALRWRRADGGLAIAWGVSLLIVVGGALNVLRAISAAVLVALVVAGVVAWVGLGGWRRAAGAAARLRSWELLTALALLLGYVNWMCLNEPPRSSGVQWSHAITCDDAGTDDGAYTLFPVRMIERGTMGIDPFCDRLTVSALGGESFLQALVLAVLPIEYIHLVDPGLAYLAMGVMIFSMRRLAPPTRSALAVAFATYPTQSLNASAVAMPVVLLAALARILGRPRAASPGRHAVGVALPLAALLTLKMTLIPGGVLLVVLWAILLALLTRQLSPLARGALAGVLALAMIAPWMACSYRSAGTPLYPLLGEGFRRHTLVSIPHRAGLSPGVAARKILTEVVPTAKILVLLIGAAAASVGVFRRRTAAGERAALLAGLAASLACIALYGAMFPPRDLWRYFYAYAAFATILAYAAALRWLPTSGRWRYLRATIYLILAAFILHYGAGAIRRSRDLPRSVADGLAGRARFPAGTIDRYRRLQASIPEGTRFFCVVPWPASFDLARNDVFYADNIGSVSPPPGIPLSGTPDQLADHLRSAGIRYVACPTPERMTVWIDSQSTPESRAIWGNEYWILTIFQNRVRLYELLRPLAARARPLYEDDDAIMIDLEAAAGRPDREN